MYHRLTPNVPHSTDPFRGHLSSVAGLQATDCRNACGKREAMFRNCGASLKVILVGQPARRPAPRPPTIGHSSAGGMPHGSRGPASKIRATLAVSQHRRVVQRDGQRGSQLLRRSAGRVDHAIHYPGRQPPQSAPESSPRRGGRKRLKGHSSSPRW